jgi:hypothetical protein
MGPSGSGGWRQAELLERLAAGLRAGLLICSASNRSTSSLQSKRPDVDCEVSLGPKPGGAPPALEDRALELPTVLGARDVAADATEATEGGPRFTVNASS